MQHRQGRMISSLRSDEGGGAAVENLCIMRARVSRPMYTQMLADGAWEGRSRSEKEVMQGHRRRRATQRSPTNIMVFMRRDTRR